MKIVVLTGSPHKNGTSFLLADKFIEGAEESGHEVYRFDSAFKDLNPCLGCNHCLRHNSICIHEDDMRELNPKLIEADLIVFCTPLYYFGMTAQIKMVIDRFYANNLKLMNDKKAVLLATAADNLDWTMSSLEYHYETICKYLGYENRGIILATGCNVRSDIEMTDYPNQAYELGKNL
ncbi:flavodoxin family protein [Methanobrevibacter sp. AbM4]|uniref:flavodoxin family protein n=1 Tax=Methanobrevibacter sp. AbM4 TaxID=224719 RepID=UPI00033483B4|nr:flavodoxin family protein [Methanobrevibacter sp. AbM4]AGN17336.1 NADPH-dependent FMN reductase [Methanobrevibacter sp. AbM4]